jgi:hypothetical protein
MTTLESEIGLGMAKRHENVFMQKNPHLIKFNHHTPHGIIPEHRSMEHESLNGGLNRWRFRLPKIAVGSFIKRNLNSASNDAKKFAAENIRLKNVNLKNAIAAASIATMFIPGGQVVGIAAKAAKTASWANKLAKLGRIGRLATKAIKLSQSPYFKGALQAVKAGIQLTKQQQQAVEQVAIAQDTDPTTPNVMTPEEFTQVATVIAPTAVQANAPIIETPPIPQVQQMPAVTPTPAQLETIAQVKGVPVEALKVNDAPVNDTSVKDTSLDQKPTDAQIETIAQAKGISEKDLKDTITPPKSNTNLIIGVVAGVAVLGVVGYVASR